MYELSWPLTHKQQKTKSAGYIYVFVNLSMQNDVAINNQTKRDYQFSV